MRGQDQFRCPEAFGVRAVRGLANSLERSKYGFDTFWLSSHVLVGCPDVDKVVRAGKRTVYRR